LIDKEFPIHFFTIVLNGEPLIRYHIEVLRDLPFRWHWHIIEGVANIKYDDTWCLQYGGKVIDELHLNGLSNDGTTKYLDRLAKEYSENITIYRKQDGGFWEGRREMVNVPLRNINEECLLWQVDCDEFWTLNQIVKIRTLFLQNPDKTAAYFYCYFFVGPQKYISSKSTPETFPNHNQWPRVWRFKPGMYWVSHSPPILLGWNVDQINPFTSDETIAQGIKFQHFAYVTEKQLRFKEINYGYVNAVAYWRGLQKTKGPVNLSDYLPWWGKSDVIVDDWLQSGEKLLLEGLLKEESIGITGKTLCFKEDLKEIEKRLKKKGSVIQFLRKDRGMSDFEIAKLLHIAAQFYVEEQKFKEAEETYKECLSLEETPDFLKFYMISDYANLLFSQLQRYKEAESKFKEALFLEPVDKNAKARILVNLGNFYLFHKRFTQAEEEYRKALAIDPWDKNIKTSILTQLGNFYTQQGKYKEAESKYNEALSIENLPHQLRFHAILGLASLYTQQGKHKEAESKYNEALSIEVADRERFYAILGLAGLYTQSVKYEQAEKIYKEALSMKIPPSERFHVIWSLGSFYIQQQKYKEAEEKLDQALSLADSIESVLDVANIHYNKGSMYERMGLFNEAKREFKATLALIKDTTSSRERELKGGAYFHLGCIYKKEKDRKAKCFFKKCLLYIPNHKKAKEELFS
jgi:tetratricopeptide (TPR) repeat protein